jgi:hypothetical protein
VANCGQDQDICRLSVSDDQFRNTFAGVQQSEKDVRKVVRARDGFRVIIKRESAAIRER